MDRQSLAQVSQGSQIGQAPQIPQVGATRHRWTAWPLRMLLTLHAAMAIAQPILIGRYLDGDFDRLATHGTNGSVLPAIVLLCLGGALCHWAIGRGRFWPVLATALLVPVEGMQIGAGHAHNLTVHIPLGTSIVALAVLLAAWSWTPRVHQSRACRATTEPLPAQGFQGD
jgi:cytochrome b561